MNVFEIVMSMVKVVAIGENHPGKTNGLIFELEQLGETTHQVVLKTCTLGEIVSPIHGITQVQAAEEVMVFPRRGPHLRIEL